MPCPPVSPLAPVSPVSPLSPLAPCAPGSPCGPTICPTSCQASSAPQNHKWPNSVTKYPSSKLLPVNGRSALVATVPSRVTLTPCAPVAPVSPCGPCAPVSPFNPRAPVSPLSPLGPVAPVSPCGPVAPGGTVAHNTLVPLVCKNSPA